MSTAALAPAAPVLIQQSLLGEASRWLRFERPIEALEARSLDEIAPLLDALEAATGRGLWAAGYFSYEAAPAFDPALAAHPPGELPLAWWGLFEAPEEVPEPARPAAAPALDWRPAVERAAYLRAIARPGSVEVGELFAVETYPTLHQLTSTVGARSSASVGEILRALYPSASITGAPKVRTSTIIRELEPEPRGVYTGTVGYFAPGRRAQLNVAIRTAVVDRERGRARYGTGGGIVWDSRAEDEYEECRTKARVLGAGAPSFGLLETMLWRPRSGYFLRRRHLERLAASARYFDYRLDPDELERRLDEAAVAFAARRHRVRLVVERDGRIALSAEPFPCAGRVVWSVALADRPVDSSHPMLFHKTTDRRLYEEAQRRAGACDEVVLWNERGELTESRRANLVLEIDGELLTPALDCGLLPGTYRAELLARGRIREAVLPVAALAAAERAFLVNSLRGWIRVERPAARFADAPGEPGRLWIG